MPFKIELGKIPDPFPNGMIFGRLYQTDEGPFNPGVINYYPDDWLELWLSLNRCEILNVEVLERCLENGIQSLEDN